jgi:phosphoribosyl-ATP pyrophosphohydrolase
MGKFSQLEKLADDIVAKANAAPDTSYTAQLIARGVEKCAKKFGEEAVELALASVQGKTKDATAEAADVFYHLLVLLHATGVKTEDVMAELKHREGTSGLVEKAARSHA